MQLRGGVSGFRGGVSGWGRDAVRSAWKRGTIQQGHFQMHTGRIIPVSKWLITMVSKSSGFRGGASGRGFEVSGWGFGVGS